MSKKGLNTVTINCKGLESDINAFMSLALRFGVAVEVVTDNKAQKASKPVANKSKAKSGAVEVGSIKYYKQQGCAGYVDKNGAIIPVAKYDNKNACYWLAKTDKGGAILKDDKGRVITLFDRAQYDNKRNEMYAKHTYKANKTYKTPKARVYGSLKWIVTTAQVVEF